jgi:hypothetical protein
MGGGGDAGFCASARAVASAVWAVAGRVAAAAPAVIVQSVPNVMSPLVPKISAPPSREPVNAHRTAGRG